MFIFIEFHLVALETNPGCCCHTYVFQYSFEHWHSLCCWPKIPQFQNWPSLLRKSTPNLQIQGPQPFQTLPLMMYRLRLQYFPLWAGHKQSTKVTQYTSRWHPRQRPGWGWRQWNLRTQRKIHRLLYIASPLSDDYFRPCPSRHSCTRILSKAMVSDFVVVALAICFEQTSIPPHPTRQIVFSQRIQVLWLGFQTQIWSTMIALGRRVTVHGCRVSDPTTTPRKICTSVTSSIWSNATTLKVALFSSLFLPSCNVPSIELLADVDKEYNITFFRKSSKQRKWNQFSKWENDFYWIWKNDFRKR